MTITRMIQCVIAHTTALQAINMAFSLALTVVLMGISWWTFCSGEHIRRMRQQMAEQEAEIKRLKEGWAKSVAGD